MFLLLFFLKFVLAGFFTLAAVGKLLDLSGGEKAMRDFGVPEKLAPTFAVFLITAEFLTAFLLIFPPTDFFGAFLALVLLVTFVVLMLKQLNEGNTPDCHCFGQIHSEPISRQTIIRNVFLMVLALVVLVLSWRNSEGDAALRTENAAGLYFLAYSVVTILLIGIFLLQNIYRQQIQTTEKLAFMELAARFDAPVEAEREEASVPLSGLLIGAPAPEFSLPDLFGKQISLAETLKIGAKSVLLFFVNPECNPCGELLPEINQWQREFRHSLTIIFISGGKAAENFAKFGKEKLVVLQNEREVAEAFRAVWTPSAVLVNTEGKIASTLATGDGQIRQLIESFRQSNGAKFVANDKKAVHELEPGTDAPNFDLQGLYGTNISDDYLKGRQTLILGWSISCGYCAQMLDDWREWETRKPENLQVLILSRGDAEENRELNLRSPIALDDNLEVQRSFGIMGTPSALIVDDKGKIASSLAVGASEIWSLLGEKI